VIVLAELIYLFERRRTTVSLKQVLTEIDRILSYHIISLDRAQIEEVAKLTGISEMHDRMIVAVTRLRGAKLITKDQEIKDSGLVDVVWA
jgi:predicted nucleic acid-binding protein